LKWWINASIDDFMSARFGGAILPSSVVTGPAPLALFSFSQHCFMILTDWRISFIRMR